MIYLQFLFLMCVSICDSSELSGKNKYVIGGYLPGTPAQLLHQWSPVLSNYLTETVGPLYDPPIQFELIAVDYDPSIASSTLIASGELDFMCRFS